MDVTQLCYCGKKTERLDGICKQCHDWIPEGILLWDQRNKQQRRKLIESFPETKMDLNTEIQDGSRRRPKDDQQDRGGQPSA
jgi:hypothetical protein